MRSEGKMDDKWQRMFLAGFILGVTGVESNDILMRILSFFLMVLGFLAFWLYNPKRGNGND